MLKKRRPLQCVVWKEGGYYISQCLEVDVSSFGKTQEESLEMLKDALELYFEDSPFPKSKHIKDPTLFSVNLQHA